MDSFGAILRQSNDEQRALDECRLSLEEMKIASEERMRQLDRDDRRWEWEEDCKDRVLET